MNPPLPCDVEENHPDLWRGVLPFPDAGSNKYTRGTVLIRGGAVMTGAARLAARAAQRAGAGLVTLAAPSAVWPVYAQALESVIVRSCSELREWQALVEDGRYAALVVGMGLGVGKAQAEEVLVALKTRRPMVLDADGLTNFACDPKSLFDVLHPDCVVTPHEGEFARLFGEGGGDRIARTCAAAEKAGGVVLLKGAETVIAAPGGRVCVNRNAPPWLATAGSGDVLAGIIGGLVAQKMPVFEAAAAGAWIHGAVAARHGAGLIAEDLVAGLPGVLGGFVAG